MWWSVTDPGARDKVLVAVLGALAASHSVSVIEVRVLAGVSPTSTLIAGTWQRQTLPCFPPPQRMQLQPWQGFGIAVQAYMQPRGVCYVPAFAATA